MLILRRLTVVLITLLTLGATAPAWADPTSDTLLLFGAMLAPLLNNAPPPPAGEGGPSIQSTSPTVQLQSVRSQPEPMPQITNIPPNMVLAPLSSPTVRRWSMRVMLGELGLTVVMGLVILVMVARNTSQLHRVLKDHWSGRRRCALR